MRLPLAAALVGLLACGAARQATAQEIKILPVKGVYGLAPSRCEPGPGLVTAQLAEAFCAELDQAARLRLGAHFAERVRGAFPGVVTSLADQIAPGETAEGRLSKTLIASLHVSRVDLWRVEKPAAVDVYVPLTLSLFLTNALSGEVLFVENFSTVVQGTLSRESYLEQARTQLPGQLNSAVDQLVQRAASRFKPRGLTGKVRDRVGDRYVFDLGRKGGIREGDTIGPDAQVVFSDANYSIIEPLLGSLSVGQALTRQVTQPVEVLEKPSAMVVVGSVPEDASAGYVTATFEEALGQHAGLAITPANPSFSAIRAYALGEARVGSGPSASRALPEYFVRVSLAGLDPLDLPTNVAETRRRVFEARAFVEVMDRSGRVAFATQAADRITEEVSGGIAFSPEQRRDTVAKNALTRAAQALGREFRPAQLRLAAKPSGGEIEIADPGGALGLGATAVVLRKTSATVDKTPVWAPLGRVQVSAVENGSTRARSMEVEDLQVRSGDQIAFESGSGLFESRRRFAPCMTPTGEPSVSRRGTVTQPLYGLIATNSFAGAFRGPVYLPSFPNELQRSLGEFPQADSLAALKMAPAEICFEPVHQVNAGAEKVSGQFVTQEYSVALGYLLRRGEERLASGGLQSTLTATGVPQGADAAVRTRSLQFDLADEATKLTHQAAKSLKPPQ